MEQSQTSRDNVVSLFRENAVVASTSSGLVLSFDQTRPAKSLIVLLLTVCALVAGGFIANAGVAAIETEGTVAFLPAAASIKSPQEGVIEQILVADGDHVSAGQKIANIVTDAFDADRMSGATRRRLAEIRSDEDRLRAELGNLRAQFEQERRGAESYQALLTSQISTLTSQIAARQSAAEARQKNMEIVNNLQRQRISSGRDQNEVESQYYTSLGDKLELNVQRDGLEKELDKTAQDIKLRSLSVDAAELGLQSQLRMLEIERQKLIASRAIQLESPVNGKIQLFRRNDRAVISQGDIFGVVVPDNRTSYGIFNVNPEVRSQLVGGSKKYTMSIVTDSTVRRITGTVEQISDIPMSPDKNYVVKVRFSNEKDSFVDGSPLTLHFYRVRPQSLLGNILAVFSGHRNGTATDAKG